MHATHRSHLFLIRASRQIRLCGSLCDCVCVCVCAHGCKSYALQDGKVIDILSLPLPPSRDRSLPVGTRVRASTLACREAEVVAWLLAHTQNRDRARPPSYPIMFRFVSLIFEGK